MVQEMSHREFFLFLLKHADVTFAKLYNENDNLMELSFPQDSNISLSEDISLSTTLVDRVWLKIFTNKISFCGTFEGNNHTIKNISHPLFNKVLEGGEVKNLTLEPNISKDKTKLGSICSQNEGLLKNITVDGYVKSEGSVVGGLTGVNAGEIQGCKIKDNTSIKGDKYVGGFCGENIDGSEQRRYINSSDENKTGKVHWCSSDGRVEGRIYIGGISGKNNSMITGCTFSGTLGGDSMCGGITGEHTNNTLSNCQFERGGSIFHMNAKQLECAGGIAGVVTRKARIHNVSSKGTIDGTKVIGGICGRLMDRSVCSKSYSFALVYGDSSTGTLFGELFGETDISNVYHIGVQDDHSLVGEPDVCSSDVSHNPDLSESEVKSILMIR